MCSVASSGLGARARASGVGLREGLALGGATPNAGGSADMPANQGLANAILYAIDPVVCVVAIRLPHRHPFLPISPSHQGQGQGPKEASSAKLDHFVGFYF